MRNHHRATVAIYLGHQAPSKTAAQVTPLDITAVTACWRPLAHSTRYAYHKALRRVLREIERPDLVQHIERLADPLPREVTATDDERQALIANAKPSLRLLLLLCSDCALRVGTALKLAPQHYDPETRTISTRSKHDTVVNMPVTGEIADLIQGITRITDTALPFCSYLHGGTGRTYRVDHAYRQFKQLKAQLGITRRLTFHDLRRTTAHRAYELTGDIRVVQQLLGHRSPSTTLHYLHVKLHPLQPELLEALKAERTPRHDQAVRTPRR